MNPDELVLYTFAVSHFSEKIRWALDASGIAYREVAWTPSLHLGRALFKSSMRATTVPIVQLGKETVQDSTAILHFLAEKKAPFDLLPEEPALRKEVLEIEDRFDRVGDAVIRYAYSVVLRNPENVLEAWLPRANRLEKTLLPAIFPAVIPILRRKYKIRPDAVARASDVIHAGVDWLDARLADGRKYLAGDRFTAADVTAASLLAPLACPDEHQVYSTPTYRAGIGPGVTPFLGRPSFEWVRALYREERKPRAGTRN